MKATKPDISPNGSYAVLEAARLLGIDRRTLRRHEAAGHIPSHLNAYSKRRYLGRDLLALWKMDR